MLSCCSSHSSSVAPPLRNPWRCKLFKINGRPLRSLSRSSFYCIKIGVDEVAQVLHNKALISAGVATVIGQFSKPFTSLFYGRNIDVKAAFRSGGMPSTHSAGIVAVATSLGLERGFADSIFGMSVVLAGIIMYDAQGVRKEVGIHASLLNRIVLKPPKSMKVSLEEESPTEFTKELSSVDSESVSSFVSVSNDASSAANSAAFSLPRSGNMTKWSNSKPSSSVVDGREASYLSVVGEEDSTMLLSRYFPLKESVGHTELEVAAGALLGFLVSLLVYSIL